MVEKQFVVRSCQMGLAVDIASYQGDRKDKQKSAMKSFAESLYSARDLI